MPADPPDSGLNENHRRRLAVAMRAVDAAAGRILDLLDDRNTPTALTLVDSPLNAEEREHLSTAMKTLQKLAIEMARKYKLPPHRRNLRRAAVAELSQLWTILEDCEPRHMKGFGAVGPEAAAQLAEDLQRLLNAVDKADRELRK